MEEYFGVIKIFGGNFAMRGTMFCHGQILSVANNSALYSILGISYGGNGQTTFGLPDLRGRVPIGADERYALGQKAGSASVSLNISNLPAHTHALNVSTNTGDSSTPSNTLLSVSPKVGSGPNASQLKNYSANPTGIATMAQSAVGATGGSAAFSIMQPYLAVNYVIVTEGIYPSRP
ncbi:phage tail protein [Sphingobacterium faecale]|uniref:Phage tail protein n=1 Tax=Sphingobacterium faecale TaxID=2803775 RepID=A0ABS1R0X2_9SPHI|nr:tail fiber protein [Sphingobacterium faecale]MBL1407546.1 phage tail protein [Sphingobacterium faecale]